MASSTIFYGMTRLGYWTPVSQIIGEHSTLRPIVRVKLVTLVKGDPKNPFSIASTHRCRGGHNSISLTVPFYPWSTLIMLSVKQRIPCFESLVWLDLGLNPGLEDHWQTFYWPSKNEKYFLTKYLPKTNNFYRISKIHKS